MANQEPFARRRLKAILAEQTDEAWKIYNNQDMNRVIKQGEKRMRLIK